MAREGVLIVGCGSGLRGDDAAGPAAARRLAALGFEALDVHQLTPELAERVAGARTVFFLDAHAALAPGEVSVMQVMPGETGPLHHHASPAGLLRLARAAYGAEPEAWLVGIGGQSFEFGDKLSRAAGIGVDRAVDAVMACVGGYWKTAGGMAPGDSLAPAARR